MIRLHNTLGNTVQDFLPQQPDKVTLYTCGPTVYSELHVGNWLAYLRWDILVRTLQAEGYSVERVMNITDVGHLVSDADDGEDKMQKGARREGITAWDVAARYTESFMKGMEALGLVMPTYITKATEHIAEQIALVQTLEAKGHTYQTSDGIYFDTSTFAAYADFAQLDLSGLKEGARVTANDEKRHPSDFALWKFSPAGEQRDMEWWAPWKPSNAPDDGETHTIGEARAVQPLTQSTVAVRGSWGFPGWHLECSAMAMKYLGNTLDIHTGGIDHIPVHHTNEIAQSEAATGQPFAHYWLHANFLMVDGRKVSKSLENGHTLADLALHGFTPVDYRMFALQSHYRTETNFTWDNLASAKARLKHWQDAAVLRWQTHDTLVDDEQKSTNETTVDLLRSVQSAHDALRNDLNTPEALKSIEEAFALFTRSRYDTQQDAFGRVLDFVEQQLGIPLRALTPDIDDEAKQLLIERARAREQRDWQRSDQLRQSLASRGIAVRDDAIGQIWTYA